MVPDCTDEALPRIPGVNMLQLGLLDREPIPPTKVHSVIRFLQDYLWLAPDSPAIVLAYFLGCGFTIHEAMGRLKRLHLKANIHPELARSLIGYFGSGLFCGEDRLQGAIQ